MLSGPNCRMLVGWLRPQAPETRANALWLWGISALYPAVAFVEIKKLPLAPVVGMWYHTSRCKGFGDYLVLVLFRVVFHFGMHHAVISFCFVIVASWSGITIGIIFSSIVILLPVQPLEAVQEGFDGCFRFIRWLSIFYWGFFF